MAGNFNVILFVFERYLATTIYRAENFKVYVACFFKRPLAITTYWAENFNDYVTCI